MTADEMGRITAGRVSVSGVRRGGVVPRELRIFRLGALLCGMASLAVASPEVVSEQPPIQAQRVAIIGGEVDVAPLGTAAEALGWPQERHPGGTAGWELMASRLGEVDMVVAMALASPEGALHPGGREGGTGDLWRFVERGGAVVVTGLEAADALEALGLPTSWAGVDVLKSPDRATPGVIRPDANSTLLAYPERIEHGDAIPAAFKISGPESFRWEVAGRRGDNQPCVLVRRHGRGVLVLATARLGSATFLRNLSKLLELQRLGVAYVGTTFEYAGRNEFGLGQGFARMTLRNTSGTNEAVRGRLALAGEGVSRIHWGVGVPSRPWQAFTLDMPGVVDLRGRCAGEILLGSLDGGAHASVTRFSSNLPAFLEIEPPTYRARVSTARREPSIEIGVVLNPVMESVEGTVVKVALLDASGATLALRDVVACGPGRVSVSMPLPADAPPGEYVIEAATLRDRVFPETARATFRVVPVRPGQMFVDQDGVLLDEGRPFFPIGLYHVPAAEVEVAAKTGVNMIQLWNWEASSTNLAKIRAAGVRVLYEDQFWGEIIYNHAKNPEFYDFQTNRATRARAEAVRDDPSRAVAMWYTADEPSVGMLRHFVRIRDYWHALDEDHPTYVVSTGDPRIEAGADVFGVDVYPVYRGRRRPLTLVGDFMDAARVGVKDRKPVVAVLQAFGENERHGEKPEEVRCMTYLALAHGVRGVFWYCWKETGDTTGVEGAGHHPETIQTLTALCGEVRTLAPALLEPGRRMMKSDDGRIHAILCGSKATGRFLVYVNGEYEPADSTLAVPELEGVRLDPLFGGLDAAISKGRLKLKLPPLATGVFRVKEVPATE